MEINIVSHDFSGNELHFRESPVSAGATKPDAGVAVGFADNGGESVTVQLLPAASATPIATFIANVSSTPSNCLFIGHGFLTE